VMRASPLPTVVSQKLPSREATIDRTPPSSGDNRAGTKWSFSRRTSAPTALTHRVPRASSATARSCVAGSPCAGRYTVRPPASRPSSPLPAIHRAPARSRYRPVTKRSHSTAGWTRPPW
jgi:hypothetical protein